MSGDSTGLRISGQMHSSRSDRHGGLTGVGYLAELRALVNPTLRCIERLRPKQKALFPPRRAQAWVRGSEFLSSSSATKRGSGRGDGTRPAGPTRWLMRPNGVVCLPTNTIHHEPAWVEASSCFACLSRYTMPETALSRRQGPVRSVAGTHVPGPCGHGLINSRFPCV